MMNNQNNAMEIIENRDMRDRMAGRVDVLDKVKALTLLPDDLYVTTKMAAEYYEVNHDVLRNLLNYHRDEFEADGVKLLTGKDVMEYKARIYAMNLSNENHSLKEVKAIRSHVKLIPRRALLRIGMLLRDSHVAKQVRSYLLNVEEIARKEARDIVDRAIPHDYLSALRALITTEEARLELELANQLQAEIIAEQKPIVASHKHLTESEAEFSGSQVARLVGLGRTTLYRLLRQYGFLMKDSCAAYQKYVNEGYCHTVIHPNRNIEGKYDAVTLFTAKGLDFITRLLQRHGHLKPKGNI